MKVYDSYTGAEMIVAEKILEVKNVWVKSEIQMEFLGRIWNSLDERLQTLQLDCIKVLDRRLHEAVDEFDGIIGEREVELDMLSILGKKGKLKKGKFAIRAHAHLEKTITALEAWHRRFDPTWWLTLRVPDGGNRIDEEISATRRCFSLKEGTALQTMQKLRTAMHNPPTDMELHHSLLERKTSSSSNDSQTTLVPTFERNRGSIFVSGSIVLSRKTEVSFSPCQHAVAEGTQQAVIIDLVRPDERVKPKNLVQSVRDLAKVLNNVDTVTFGLLTCLGVVKVFKEGCEGNDSELIGFDFIFLNPSPSHQPRSLRDILLSDTAQIPLNEWFDLARQLARSILFIHAANFVHKSIHPETILCFQGDSYGPGKPFLVGFEKFRLEKGSTFQFGDELWERNIYRHPQRQGLYPEESYIMQHDIYSLGVVLLEIGLRVSFVQFQILEKGCSSEPFVHPCLESDGRKSFDCRSTASSHFMFNLKNHLCNLAEFELPVIMGHKYTHVVLSCLTCLDSNNGNFGEESALQDKDGILVGVRFIEKVSPLEVVHDHAYSNGRFWLNWRKYHYKPGSLKLLHSICS